MEMRIDDVTRGLIGRDHPVAMLRAEIGRAADSHGGLVLVTGEAGIGKTTLVTDAADAARRLGALVLGGSCWDSDNAPGYWPWVQVLRGVRRSVTPGEWSAAEEAGRGGLAALLGESPSSDVVDGFHLYDAVTSALVSISQSRPVVVVLDDLHWSALVDAAQERWDDAIEGFTAASHSADSLQALLWSIEARAHLGEALLARGRAGDVEAAIRILGDVEADARRIGMRQIVEDASQSRQRRRASEPALTSAPHGAFLRDGEVWSLGFAGRTVHLPDAKGLRDLHRLLSRPRTDLFAVELLDPEGGLLVVAARRMGGDPILDEEAKARYRRRLAQLDEEIDRAAELGEDRRAADFDRERAALLAELRSAAGLGGRDRRLGDEAERARKTVTARIRDVLRKLDRVHPELAAHLRATVSTGATCRYQPEQEISWRC